MPSEERATYHHDLEDVIAVVDGRSELYAELAATGIPVRRYVAGELRRLMIGHLLCCVINPAA
jgi:hypothetical protein